MRGLRPFRRGSRHCEARLRECHGVQLCNRLDGGEGAATESNETRKWTTLLTLYLSSGVSGGVRTEIHRGRYRGSPPLSCEGSKRAVRGSSGVVRVPSLGSAGTASIAGRAGRRLCAGACSRSRPQFCGQRRYALAVNQLAFAVLVESSAVAVPFRHAFSVPDMNDFRCALSHSPPPRRRHAPLVRACWW